MATSGHIVVEVGTDEDASAGQQPVAPVPYRLSFADLSYTVRTRGCRLASLLPVARASTGSPPPSTTKMLLDGISGEAREGELFAVMGASGSGKSTLVDALAGRITRESLGGTVTLNGEPLHGRRLRAISAYVMQDDLLYPMLTVRRRCCTPLSSASPARSPRPGSANVSTRSSTSSASPAPPTPSSATRGTVGCQEARAPCLDRHGHHPRPDPAVPRRAHLQARLGERVHGGAGAPRHRTEQQRRRDDHPPAQRADPRHPWPPPAPLRGRTVYAGTPAGLMPFFHEFGKPIPDNENPAEFALDTIRELERQHDGTALLADFNARWQANHRMIEDVNTMPLEVAISESVSRGKLVAGTVTGTASSVPTFANPLTVEVWVLIKRSFTNTRRMPGSSLCASARSC
ncbi:hypothetical protein ZWY2020_046609 [Hordeum vulgare]|nr:hypothetical protein ZWY2020_046609 [Hordeum vulgare]